MRFFFNTPQNGRGCRGSIRKIPKGGGGGGKRVSEDILGGVGVRIVSSIHFKGLNPQGGAQSFQGVANPSTPK